MPQLKELEQLYDIKTLDHIGYWPPAWGINLIIGLAVIGICLTLLWRYKQMRFKNSWQYSYYHNLLTLEKQVKQGDMSCLARDISKMVRVVAINSAPRQECAALTDEDWLQWLHDNDPNKFNWLEYKSELCHLPYSDNKLVKQQEALAIIYALKGWLKK